MKLTNTWKHAAIGSLVGLAGAGVQWLISKIPNTQFEIGWFFLIAVTFFAVRYEVWQENNSPLSTHEYLKIKWLDIIIDVVACVLTCGLVLALLGCL